MIVFGPVPSRRLGNSLGINNIAPKVCSYNCVYCQLGRTKKMQTERQKFGDHDTVFKKVTDQLDILKKYGNKVDYLTFVATGEPTIDINLEKMLDLMIDLPFKTAVISNASLITRGDVRKALSKADWVSLKVDSVDHTIWRQIDRPHKNLELAKILEGIKLFSREYSGTLVTETMLVKDINDDEQSLSYVAEFLGEINPAVAYIAIPVRPPAEKRVICPDEEKINLAYQMFSQKVDCVEYLTGYEGNAFASTGCVEKDLLSITSVHPMREEAVRELLVKCQAQWSVVEKLIQEQSLVEVDYNSEKYYVRKIGR